MGHRILVMLLAVSAVALPQVVSALGLGEITTTSALNQPLKAEIKLLQVRDLTEQEILVGLASAKDFERVKVDRPYFLTNLKFQVELNGSDGPVILVTSQKPVREPFINFVMQAQWPSGRLLREYTLLMDLPVFDDRPAQSVVAAESQPRQRQTSSASDTNPAATQPSNFNPRSAFSDAPERPLAVQQQVHSSILQGGAANRDDVYGPVKPNDTLWDIAKEVRPDRSVSIQQTMLAIQRLNPNAFINNNINLLRKGQILRVPDQAQIIEYSKREAISEVAVQNNSWSGDPNGGFGPASGAQLEGSRTIGATDARSVNREGRVKLTSPEDIDSSVAGRGAGSGSSSAEALENELAITLEQLDKSSRENIDLKSRIDALQDQIKTMERMIEISNEDMRALELSAQQNRQSQQPDTAPNAGIEPTLPEDVIQAESGEPDVAEVTEDVLSEEALNEEPTLEPTAIPTPKKVVVASRPVEKTFVDHLLDNIIFIGAGLAAILLAAFLFVRHRQSNEELIDDSEDFIGQAHTPFDDVGIEDEEFTEPSDIDDVNLSEFDEDEPEVEIEPTEADDTAEAQTEDVVAEADIYIAYGKLDQAEEMLLKALDRDASNTDVRVKLLEVYSQQQDPEKFDPHYAQLLFSNDDSAKQRGEQLRESIGGAAPFESSLYDADVSASALVDVDVDSNDQAEIPEEEVSNDFGELTLEFESTGDNTGSEIVSEADALEESLDFELDLGGENSLDQDEFGLEALSDDAVDPLDDGLALELDLSEIDGDIDFEIEASGDDSIEVESDLEFDLSDDLVEDELSLDLDIDSTEVNDADDLSIDEFDLEFDLESASEDIMAIDDSVSDVSSADPLVVDELESLSDLESLSEIEVLSEFELDESGADELLSFEEALEADLPEDSAAFEEASLEENTSELTLESGDEFDDFDLGDLDLDGLSTDEPEDLSVVTGFDLEDGLDDVSLESEFDGEPVEELPNEALNDDLSADIDSDLSLDALDAEIESLSANDEADELTLEDDFLDVLEEGLDDTDGVASDVELVAEGSNSSEDLSLTSSLDLSALDQELDELTSGLGVEEADIDSLELTAADDMDEPVAGEKLAQPTVMEEPVTDFGDFEIELEADFDEDINGDEPLDLLVSGVDDSDSAHDVGAETLEEELVEEEDYTGGEDTLFDQAIADIPDAGLDFDIPEINPESDDDDDDLGFLSDSDETATKLDLARAYIDMGDADGARDILDEILKEGNAQQKQEAENLLSRV
ncbi:FimV/HubP family polar landmark protein [Teredinibacter purpureus]|uniref:FimV/HubP family polar landmark protein n=1 Tax=Teredinibacter purpureus TaxID=2731756 RepID=UPI0005F7C00A|nr:FimV/HubP family polar landmark protein [Teredinibacter purpureus]